MTAMTKSSPQVHFYDFHPGVASLREEVLQGLRRQPKTIPPKFFYDARGSLLFDAICELPEYYPTRTEVSILQTYAEEIAALAGPDVLLIELGSGASKKVRLLLDALQPHAYLGVDISKDFLLESTYQLAADYPWLEVHAACADFSQTLNVSAYSPPGNKKLAFFPGSSIGNFDPPHALALLQQLRQGLLPNGKLLIGVDLKKNSAILNAAYNDAQGVTADFNRNLLKRIQNELDTDLQLEAFAHHAFYNEALGRVEMHLASRGQQSVQIENQDFNFAPEETIHTENSYKYSVAEFQTLAQRAGYKPERVWTDPQQLFSVHYLGLEN
jgi:dimethylhistidine N-methyltransferase